MGHTSDTDFLMDSFGLRTDPGDRQIDRWLIGREVKRYRIAGNVAELMRVTEHVRTGGRKLFRLAVITLPDDDRRQHQHSQSHLDHLFLSL